MNHPLPVTQQQEALRFVHIPVGQIVADLDQVRREFDDEFIAQLAESIKAHGVLQPIVVYPIGTGGYEIIAGENRYRAARIAGLSEIPAIIRTNLSEDDRAVIQLLENLQRKDLSLSDTVAGVTKLVEKLGLDKAAQQLGMSKSWVSKRSSVKDLPQVVRIALDNGELTDLEAAHSLSQLMELAPSDAERFTDFLKLSPEEREEEGLEDNWHKPTRDNVRDALQDAKAAIERKNERQHQEEELAEDDPAEIERQRKFKADQKKATERENKIRKLGKDCDQHASDMEEKIAAALGIRLPSLNSNGVRSDSPISINAPFISPYSGTPPKSVEQAEFGLDICCGIAVLKQCVNAAGKLAPDIRVTIENLTLDRAEKISAALSHQGIKFSFDVSATGQDLHDLVSRLKNKATPPKAAKTKGVGSVAKFISASLDKRDKAAQVKASLVYQAYADWCEQQGTDAIAFNDNSWGEAITAAGIQKKRSNGIQYVGCKLKASK